MSKPKVITRWENDKFTIYISPSVEVDLSLDEEIELRNDLNQAIDHYQGLDEVFEMSELPKKVDPIKMNGIPSGYIPVRFGKARFGEHYIDPDGRIYTWTDQYNQSISMYPILEKVVAPYRPFKDDKEFEPHRHKFWRFKSANYKCLPPAWYSDKEHNGQSWSGSFAEKTFDDGSPFGVPDK